MRKSFFAECVQRGAVSCNQRQEFWRESHTTLWLLIERIFRTREETSFAILIGIISFFACENPRSPL